MMRLLWIDDEIDMLRPFVLGLEAKGYQVETATNGPDGLELLREREFDLVLLDQVMAGMDGLEVLRRIKDIDPAILVTMVTKSDAEALIDEAYGEMVDDFLIKPFTPTQLLAVLKRLLEKRKLVSDRMAQQYLAAMNQPRALDTEQGWVDYHRSMLHWQGLLGRYGDQALEDIQSERWRSANEEFGRFVLERYRSWLSGKGPVLSHRVIEEFCRPHWEERPTYLVVLDSMRVDQWDVIAPILRDHFEVETKYYYALLPTATPYARNAIFSGLLPLDIQRYYPQYWVTDETGQNRHERELLAEQLKRLHFTGRHEYYKAPTGEDLLKARGVLLSTENRFTALVLNFLDLLIHSIRTTRLLDEIIPNDAALVGMTRVWFASSPIFELLKVLAKRDCRVIVTSDHGFVRVRRPSTIYGGREMSANSGRWSGGPPLRPRT